MTWHDDGVKLLLDISETGTFISPPFRTEYPFVSQGSGLAPVGWTPYIPTGATSTDLYILVSGTDPVSTRVQRGTNSTLSYYDLGIERTFTCTPHHVYRISALCKAYHAQTAGTTMPTLSVRFNRPDGSAGLSRQTRPFEDGMPDAVNWYTFSVDNQATDADGVGLTSIRVTLMARCPTDAPNYSVWSAMWTDFAITDVTASTAPTFTWHPVVCDTTEASIRYGRARFTERYDVGTFVVKLNNVSGEYIYHEDHPWGFRPGRMFRMRADYQGTIYPLCFGVIDRIKTNMTPDGKANVSLTVFDTTSFTSDIPTPQIAFSTESTPNDTDSLSGNRVNALLNFTGVAYALRQIDPGIFGTMNVEESGRALREEIGVTADSEGGAFFGERDGTMVYRDRSWASRDPRGGTVQANFTAYPADLTIDPQPDDIPTDPNAPVICPIEMDTDWSLERVINQIILSVSGGTKRFYSDQPSQTANGIKTYQRLDFVNRGGTASNFLGGTLSQQLQMRADDIFSTSLTALLRVQRLSYRPSPATWKWTFTAFLNWLVRVFYYIRDGNWGFVTVVRIQSIEHRITPRDWVVMIDVDQPISYSDNIVPLPPGGWDNANWDGSVWDDIEYTNSALWSSAFNWSDPTSTWGE